MTKAYLARGKVLCTNIGDRQGLKYIWPCWLWEEQYFTLSMMESIGEFYER